MMKIAILADFPLSALESGALGRGGGQGCTWLPQLALSFERMENLEVHWVVLDRKGREEQTVRAHGQYFHSLPTVRFSVDLALNCLPSRRKLRRTLVRIQPDLIHTWGTERIYPAALADFKGPGILSMQGVLTEYARIGGLPNDWRWRKMIRSEPKFMRAATVVTSESQWGIDRVREVVPDADIRMVEYGVHPGFYEVQWDPSPSVPYALYVGGSDWRKGADLLIEALKYLPDRRWELRMAGDERLAAMVGEAGLENVSCLGLLPWNEMKKQLAGAWCSVLPTRGDTSPNSVKEARVIGVPVVASSHGGHAGYLQDSVNGRIVDPLTPEGLATVLDEVMSSHSSAVVLGKGRHSEDREYLHPSRTAEGFAEIYRDMVPNI